MNHVLPYTPIFWSHMKQQCSDSWRNHSSELNLFNESFDPVHINESFWLVLSWTFSVGSFHFHYSMHHCTNWATVSEGFYSELFIFFCSLLDISGFSFLWVHGVRKDTSSRCVAGTRQTFITSASLRGTLPLF